MATPRTATDPSELGPLTFQSHGTLTLGVELEVQLVDWRTKDLCPAAPRILKAMGGETARLKPEIFQAMLEICTGVCASVAEVERDLAKTRADLLAVADDLRIEVHGAGAHPFARPEDRLVYNAERYHRLIDRNQWIARRLVIFGLHVHVGMPDGDTAMKVANGLLPRLPALLALSASSPFMYGQDTGLASARSTVFESQPTAGMPPTFDDWNGFAAFCQRLHRCRAITSLKDLWWDLRPNPSYGTLEVRICDGNSLADALALVALVQATCAHLLAEIGRGNVPGRPAAWRLRENKWRAARWGLEADLVSTDDGDWRPSRDAIRDWLAEVAPFGAALGSTAHLAQIERMLSTGTSTDRQRTVVQRTRSLGALVESLVEEWRG